MFSKSTFFLAFAAAASVAVHAHGTPPGCLLGAVNSYDDPADIPAVCKSKNAVRTIQKFCGEDTADALSAFADICNEAGVEVSTKLPSTATGTARPTGTGASIPTGTDGSARPTGTGADGSGSTGSEDGEDGEGSEGSDDTEESTGAAGKVEFSAAALLAGLGIMVAAL